MSLRSRALYVDDIRESRDAWSGIETSSTADMTWQQDYQRTLPKRLKRKSNRLRNACLCLVGLWIAGVLWFLVGFLKKRNSEASNALLQGSGTKETPSLRAGARHQPDLSAARDLDPVPSSKVSSELSGGNGGGHEGSAQHPWGAGASGGGGGGSNSGDADGGAEEHRANNQAGNSGDGNEGHRGGSQGSGDGGDRVYDDANGAAGSGAHGGGGGGVRRVLTHTSDHHHDKSLDEDSNKPADAATTNNAALLPLSPLPRVHMDSASFPVVASERLHSRSATTAATAAGATSAVSSTNGTVHRMDTKIITDSAQHSAAGKVSGEAGGWSNALLQKAYVAVQKQYPLCGAKMRWYCEQEGLSDQCANGDVAILDAMQAKVVEEGRAAAASQAAHDQRVAAAASAAKTRALKRQQAARRAAASGAGVVALPTTTATTAAATATTQLNSGADMRYSTAAGNVTSAALVAASNDQASVVPKTALLPLTHLLANDHQQHLANSSLQEGSSSLAYHSWGSISDSLPLAPSLEQQQLPPSSANLNGGVGGPTPDPEPASSSDGTVKAAKTVRALGRSHDGAQGNDEKDALACPAVASFSLGRVWGAAHRWEELRRRNEDVPYWRQKLLAAGQRAAAALQPEVAQWWPSSSSSSFLAKSLLLEQENQEEEKTEKARQEEEAHSKSPNSDKSALKWLESGRQLRGLFFGGSGDGDSSDGASTSGEERPGEDEKEVHSRKATDAVAAVKEPNPISLLIVVLTYPRPGDPPFLLDTIGALETAIADLSTSPSTSSAAGAGHLAHVGVTVMNSAAPGQMHTRFAEAKQRNKERGGSATTKVAFFSNPFLAEQPEPEDYITSPVARQISTQSWHVAAALATASALAHSSSSPSHLSPSASSLSSPFSSPAAAAMPISSGSNAPPPAAATVPEYVMLVEDDMCLCGGALPVLLADIRAAATTATTTAASTAASSAAVATSAAPADHGAAAASNAAASHAPSASPLSHPFNALLVSYGLNGLVLRARDIAPPPLSPLTPSLDTQTAIATANVAPLGNSKTNSNNDVSNSSSSSDSDSKNNSSRKSGNTGSVSSGNIKGDEESSSSSSSPDAASFSSQQHRGESEGPEKSGFLLDFLLENRHPAGCEACVTPPDLAAYEWAGLHLYPPYQMDPTYRAPPNGAYTRSTNLFHHLGAHASTFEDRSFEVPDQYRCGGPLQFSSDQNLGVHVLNRHWFSSDPSEDNGTTSAAAGALNSSSAAAMTSSMTSSKSSSSRVDVVTLGRGLGGTAAARAAAHAAIGSVVHRERGGRGGGSVTGSGGGGGGGGDSAAAVGATTPTLSSADAGAATSIEGKRKSSELNTVVEEPVNGAVSLLRKAKERGAARHHSAVTHRNR